MKEISVDTDKSRLDPEFICNFISNSYWAKGRTLEQVKKSIEHSLNFGLYQEDRQIGYARVITDYTTFAYLADVFITEAKRGKGYAQQLMESIFSHPDLADIKNWKLATADAHSLYKKFGFRALANPEEIMERKT